MNLLWSFDGKKFYYVEMLNQDFIDLVKIYEDEWYPDGDRSFPDFKKEKVKIKFNL